MRAIHISRRRLAGAGVITAGVAMLIAPGSALAGEAVVENGVARYQAYANEANRLTVGELPGAAGSGLKTVVFKDIVPIDRGADCAPLSGSGSAVFEVVCTVPNTTNVVRAGLEDESDRIEPSAANPPTTMRFSAEGDGGNDVLIGTALNDVLDGVGGDDDIFGRAGNDNLQGAGGADDVLGEAGVDTLSGGAQADDLNGGTGHDAMFGDTGNDNLNANDHAGGDTLDCGEHLFDDDLAVFNLGDTVASDCERTRLEP